MGTCDNGDCFCDLGFQGQTCNKVCQLANGGLSLSFVFDTSGSLTNNKREVQDNFVKDLIDMFDTQNTVDVSIISVGDCAGGQSGPTPQMNVDFAQSHADGATLQNAVDGMTWYGETTAIACALDEGANQMNTGDNINDVMIVLTDGWDSEQGDVSTSAGNVAAAGITTLVIGYDTGSTPPSPGTLDIIANGVGSNVFNQQGDVSSLDGIREDVFNTICGAASSRLSPGKAKKKWVMPEIQQPFVWKAVAKYVDKFDALPDWTPCYKEYRESQFTKVPNIFSTEC